ncbi:MAG: M24 family metallopeptidase [Actinomycetota bacterium]
MTTHLLYDSATRSPEVRHEISENIGDEVAFLDHDGHRIVAGPSLEAEVFAKREDVVDEFWSYIDLGLEALRADDGVPATAIGAELVVRAVQRLGVDEVIVPPTFRVQVADLLRARGVQVIVDSDSWAARRRRKTPAELEGCERAQRSAEVAMLSAARMLREAEPTTEGRLRFEGEILTAEWVREAMTAVLVQQGTDSDEIIVQSGDACLKGHDPGSGPILPNESCIIDVFPHDRRTGTFSDMTRTFVPGRPSDDLVKLHHHCREALSLALDACRPGTDDLYGRVADFMNSHGHPSQLHPRGAGSAGAGSAGPQTNQGFFHALGHGVGLEVHERPFLGRRCEALVPGDVIALEPGLYYEGVGGVRLEDTVLITDDGFEFFTDPYPYDLEP